MAYIEGSDDSNDIDGTSGNDTILGYDGDDVLHGLGGNDKLYGGAGDDDLWGGTGINNLWGGSGDDYFVMSARTSKGLSDNYIADFELGDDTIDLRAWGVSDFSQIKALLRTTDDGDAYLNASYGGRSNFVTIGGVEARDLESSDFVYSNAKASTILGSKYSDTLFGSRSGDIIKGGNGGDTLLGGQGNDDLYGGAGKDTLIGGSGDDLFVFVTASESAASSNRDRITDFSRGHDQIDLSDIDAIARTSANNSFDWIGTGKFEFAGELRYSYSGKDTIISGNTDTDSTAEFQIALSGHVKLSADDFIL